MTLLEVVEVGEDEADLAVEPGRAGELEAERVLGAPPVGEPGEAVDESLVLDEPVQLRVLEGDDRLGGQRRARSRSGAASNDAADDHEMPEVGGAGPKRERDPLAGCVGLAGPCDLAVAADHDPAGGTGRLDGRLDDDAQELPRIVRRDQRLAEPLGRVADPRPLGLDVEPLLLELGGHVVERARELRELVAAANLDALAEPPARDRVGRLGEAPQRRRRPSCRAGR